MRVKTIMFCAALMLAGQANATADDPLSAIENRWAEIRYSIKGGNAQLAALKPLRAETEALTLQHPDAADVLAWHALVLLMEADARRGISSLGLAKQARDLLENAEKIDTGSAGILIHTTLGALYNEIPPWPIGFHDDDKARAHFARALALDGAGMDANYFYGDYLVRHHRYVEALPYLEKALAAPVRPGHLSYDAGRRGEVEEALAIARQKIK